MRKTTLIVLLMTMSLIANSVLAQVKKPSAKKTTTTLAIPVTETGPTKEETIAWLKEKLTLYSPFKYYIEELDGNFTINECEIVLQYKYKKKIKYGEVGYNPSELITFHYPIKGMTFMGERYKWGQDYSFAMFAYKYDAISSEYSNEIKKHMENVSDYMENVSHYEMRFNSEGEPDLVPRMQKAFAHLATFCPEKKETF